MLKNNVLHGVGEAVIYDLLTGREILRLTRMESTSWTATVDETDVSGGDKLDVFDNFETGRSQMMAFQNNEFDMRMLEAAMGKRPVKTLSAPIMKLSEGIVIPVSAPFTATLKKATAQAESVRILNNETREELAPQPPFSNAGLALNLAAVDFAPGTTVKVRITAIVNGVESIASAEGTISTGAAARGIDVSIPEALLSIDPNLVSYDVEVSGYNVYLAISTGPWKKNNAALIDKGETYALLNTYPTPITATPGAGLTNPPTIAYNAAYSVIPFVVAAPAMTYNIGLTQYEANGDGVIGKGIYLYNQDVLLDTADECYFVYDALATLGTKVLTGGAGTVITPDDTDDYDALLVYKASTGMRGTLYVAQADVAAFLAANPQLTLDRQIVGIFTAPIAPPDDFVYVPGALTGVNESGYVASPLFLAVGASIYDQILGGLASGSEIYLGNDAAGVLHTIAGLTTGLIIDNIDESEDINITIITDGVADLRTQLHSANIDPATILPIGFTIVATFESVFTKPAAPNTAFTYNAGALVEWPTGDTLYLVPTLSGQFSVSGADITFADVDANMGVLVDYVWTTSATEYEAEVVDVLTACLRKYVKIVLGQTLNAKDGTEVGYQALVYKAKYTGDFTLDRSRTDAATHSLEFKVFDPERADGKIVSFTKYGGGESQTC